MNQTYHKRWSRCGSYRAYT